MCQLGLRPDAALCPQLLADVILHALSSASASVAAVGQLLLQHVVRSRTPLFRSLARLPLARD